jgi:hypothetical protein
MTGRAIRDQRRTTLAVLDMDGCEFADTGTRRCLQALADNDRHGRSAGATLLVIDGGGTGEEAHAG